jgi:hypothetical protein
VVTVIEAELELGMSEHQPNNSAGNAAVRVGRKKSDIPRGICSHIAAELRLILWRGDGLAIENADQMVSATIGLHLGGGSCRQ